MAKPEIILEIKTYADGVLVNRSVKVIKKSWLSWPERIILAIVIPIGLWVMTMKGMF